MNASSLFLSNIDRVYLLSPWKIQHNRLQASCPIVYCLRYRGSKNGHALIFETFFFLIRFWWLFVFCKRFFTKNAIKVTESIFSLKFSYKRGRRVLKMWFCRKWLLLIFYPILMVFCIWFLSVRASCSMSTDFFLSFTV